MFKENFSSKITAYLVDYTVAHKRNKRQLLAIPALYENKHRPSQSGRPLCACLNASSTNLCILFKTRKSSLDPSQPNQLTENNEQYIIFR